MLNKGKKNATEKEKAIKEKKLQDLINVRDIVEGKLYTKDNYIQGYIKVLPVNINLLSKAEKKRKREMIKEKLNNENHFEFLKLSKSVDLSEQIHHLQTLAKECDNNLKKMGLLQSIRASSRYSQQGEMVENQYYYMFRVENKDNHSEKELEDKLTDFINKLAECEIKGYILNDIEITDICNLFCNPSAYDDHFELNDYVTSFID